MWLLVEMFYVVGYVADAYLTPALELVANYLKCSESLAGATLLGIGNEFNTVFGFTIAISGGYYDLGIGGILGGGFLMSNFLVGACILAHRKCVVFP